MSDKKAYSIGILDKMSDVLEDILIITCEKKDYMRLYRMGTYTVYMLCIDEETAIVLKLKIIGIAELHVMENVDPDNFKWLLDSSEC